MLSIDKDMSKGFSISYTDNAAIVAPVNASISTPVFQILFTLTRILTWLGSIVTSTFTSSIGIGWQYGIRSEVFLAPRVPDTFAISKIFPFGEFPSLIMLIILLSNDKSA